MSSLEGWTPASAVPPWPIATRREPSRLLRSRMIAGRLSGPRFSLRARSCRLGLPRTITRRRRFVGPWPPCFRRFGPTVPRLVAPRFVDARMILPRPIVARPACPPGCVTGFVAIALRRRILLRPRALGTILLLEPIPRILVRTAGTPVAVPPFGSPGPVAASFARRQGGLFLFLKIVVLHLSRWPQPAACKPAHDDVGVLPL